MSLKKMKKKSKEILRMANKNPRSRSRTQQRYARKKAVAQAARPVQPTGNGQGGFLGGFSAGGMI